MKNVGIHSQSELARRLGVFQSTFGYILKRGKEGAATETLKKLAVAYDVSFTRSYLSQVEGGNPASID
jgi:transcriptional regulator with XRE-family HTH domain